MSQRVHSGDTRDRLLLAAAQLMDEAGEQTLSTRAVCERAGVRAPTLYHHFGSKQGLVDAVIDHGFTQYVLPPDAPRSDDPVEALREGWDRHVQFGLTHPTFYALLYGRVEPGTPCAITAPARAMLQEMLVQASRRGLLGVPVDDAADRILAANVGITLTLITRPPDERDMGLSERTRDMVLSGVLHDRSGSADVLPTMGSAAITLRGLLAEQEAQLSPGERTLLIELLDRLAGAPTTDRASPVAQTGAAPD